jgi:hypothetical protein
MPAAAVMSVAFAQAVLAPATPSPKPSPAGASVKAYRDKDGVTRITNTPANPFQGDIMVAGCSSAGEARSSGKALKASQATETMRARKPGPQNSRKDYFFKKFLLKL